MNLGQIRERIESALQYAPTVTGWTNEVGQKVNDKYVGLLTRERWPFRVTEAAMRLRADETGVTFKVNSGSPFVLALRESGGVRDVRYHDLDALLLRSGDTEDSLRRFGRVSGAAGNWPIRWTQVKYKYDGVGMSGWPDPDLDTTVTLDTEAFLDEPPATTYRNVTYTDGILRHDRYQLPYDCAEIIGFVQRDQQRGEIHLVNRTAERSMMLNTNLDVGTPQAWILDGTVDAGPSPRKTLVAAGNAMGGSLAAATYRYFYVFFGKGTMSGPSNIVSVTTTGATSTVDLSVMEAEPVPRYWRDKLIFRDDGDGVFRYLATRTAAQTDYTDTGGVAPDEQFRWDDRMAAPRKAVRFWPRPSTDQFVSVSYLRAPNRLVTDQDTPEMPEEYHEYLVHAVVAEFATQFEAKGIADTHRAQAEEVLNRMMLREVAPYDTRQRSPWRAGRNRPAFPRSTITFTG